MGNQVQTSPAILRLNQVKQRTGLSRSTIYAQMALGDFPRKVQLGARCVGWLSDEIDRHLRQRAESRTASPAGRKGGHDE